MRKWVILSATLVLLACITGTCLGYNTWIKTVGTMAAGFLFGAVATKPPNQNLGP